MPMPLTEEAAADGADDIAPIVVPDGDTAVVQILVVEDDRFQQVRTTTHRLESRLPAGARPRRRDRAAGAAGGDPAHDRSRLRQTPSAHHHLHAGRDRRGGKQQTGDCGVKLGL